MRKYRNRRRRDNPSGAIYEDSRRADKKLGRENDLTHAFIQAQLEKGCSYCGETEIRMTKGSPVLLDKIQAGDNFIPMGGMRMRA